MVQLADTPSIGRAIRGAAVDFYYNSWRLVPANVAWAATLVVLLLVGGFSFLGLLLVSLLAVPTSGLFSMAALLARSEPTALGDFASGIRATWRQTVLVGIGGAALALVLTTNLLVGLQADHPLGWFVAAAAFWGEVSLGLGLLALWPILADPHRADLPLHRRIRLAALVVLVRPVRLLGLGLVVGVVLFASVIAFAALLTVSAAYLALVTARVVLPIADRLEPVPRRDAER